MKKTILLLLVSFSLYAQPYTTKNITGVWEVSSLKLNGFTSFGKEFSKKRGEVYTLIFNKTGEVKNQTTNTIYNYEIVNNQLKIYQTKTYKNNYKIKDKKHYDLWKISGTYENCYKSKIVKKKIPGYYRKEGYKWCKVQEYPQPISTTTPNYNFR
ncbi:hypothetical protein MLC35_10275 [Sulfurimonas sp. NW7]|uniref:hypothetical protein n=1 Tax=Sulfurimonas sp. NW7 TaxID=2922727 RepID=UPI003DA82338